MVDLTLLLEDEDLRRRYGTATLDRARDYVERGMVLTLTHDLDDDGDLDIRGSVAGSTGAPYAVNVSVGLSGDGVWVYSRCSCPVAEGCKHAVALLMTVREDQERANAADGGAGTRRWERQLASVLDELDDLAGRAGSSADKPLALQIELNRRTSRTGYRAWAAAQSTPQRGTLRIRPLQRGARDNWIRSGVSWQDVPHLGTRRAFDQAQVTVLNEILAAYRAASRQTYFGSETHLPLSSFNSSVWSLLDRATRAGLPLVPGAGLADVVISTAPVALQVDVNAAPERDTHLRVGVTVGEEWYSADDIDVLGDSGHGVALWLPGDRPQTWALTLAPLVRPAGPEVRRLLAAGDALVVPADDRDDLVTEYLPRLQRHVPVISSDGSVAVPEPATARLALTVTWVAVDEVTIAWSWRYRVGEDDRVYGLSRDPRAAWLPPTGPRAGAGSTLWSSTTSRSTSSSTVTAASTGWSRSAPSRMGPRSASPRTSCPASRPRDRWRSRRSGAARTTGRQKRRR